MSVYDVSLLRSLCKNKIRGRVGHIVGATRRSSTAGNGRQARPNIDGRHRLSNLWTPTTSISKQDGTISNQEMLARGAIMRQAHAGIFHLLPLGLRVQEKIEKLIDMHMGRLGAAKVSLSSITSEALWQRSGRGRDDEFFHLQDRKRAKYLLSPTHEEEITTIVAASVSSYKDLPLRLYQVSRKYRDEARPRQGLLRAREFVMKDLYTFDTSETAARATYDQVRKAYRAIFSDLGLPFVEAAASSGNMGGNHSHEYHLLSSLGEDTVIRCRSCGFAANEEVFTPGIHDKRVDGPVSARTTYGISADKQSLYKIITPQDSPDLNVHLVKKLLPELDSSIDDPQALWNKLVLQKPDANAASQTQGVQLTKAGKLLTLFDPRCPLVLEDSNDVIVSDRVLTRPQSGDECPSCGKPELDAGQATEVGHTFLLGTRYSEPLSACVKDESGRQVAVQMGCHGIGVSRLIAATSGLLSDQKGLNWPLSIAPFSVLITALPSGDLDGHAETVYDQLTTFSHHREPSLDFVLDDRQKPLGYKLNDADIIGYPFIVVLGRAYLSHGLIEVQCRRLGIKKDVELARLGDFIDQCAVQLRTAQI